MDGARHSRPRLGPRGGRAPEPAVTDPPRLDGRGAGVPARAAYAPRVEQTDASPERAVTRASGVGSWPGTDVREAVVTVRDLLGGDHGLPYLPELPARGPGADLIGRAAGLLVEMPVDLQPSGWRFVDRPGRDAGRTAAFLHEDLDVAAEAYDGYAGELKVQVAGPWTLAASVELNRGERAVVDEGATRDIVDSLAQGVAAHVADVRRLVPGARVVLQLDEPSLLAVLGGTLPTASGYGRIRAVDRQVVARGLRAVLAAHDGPTVVHCCALTAPLPLLRLTGTGAVSLDLTGASPARWESVAATLEEGIDLYAGVLASDGTGSRDGAVRAVVEGLGPGRAGRHLAGPRRRHADVRTGRAHTRGDPRRSSDGAGRGARADREGGGLRWPQ